MKILPSFLLSCNLPVFIWQIWQLKSKSLIQWTLSEWNNSAKIFLLLSIAPYIKTIIYPNKIFRVSLSIGLLSLARLALGLSHLRERKFHNNFTDSQSAIISLQSDDNLKDNSNAFFLDPASNLAVFCCESILRNYHDFLIIAFM